MKRRNRLSRMFREQLPDGILTAAIFGGFVLYCVVGAVRGRLVIPHTKGPDQRDAILSGPAAWTMAGVFLLWGLSVSVRQGFISFLTRRERLVCEFVLFILGILLMMAVVGGSIPTVTRE